MTGFYPHVYLSPHLDDAVLSCGGLIHQQATAGRNPLVVTIFAGRPPPDLELSAFAQSLHARWGNPADLVVARWDEDRAALAVLGADYVRLDYVDCIYRRGACAGRPAQGAVAVESNWYYASEEAIFAMVHPDEAGLPAELATTLSEMIPPGDGVTLYAPLTVGNHVDHQLVFSTALILRDEGWQVQFYEDYPYAESEGALSTTLADRGAEHWQSATVALDEDHLAAKIEAISCYSSQLGVLFDSAEAMPSRVRDHIAQGGGERLWWPDSD